MRGKALVTGLHGTLAPLLAQHLRERGWAVEGWDRARVPPNEAVEAQRFLEARRPDAVFHLATGDVAWAALLARHAARADIPLLFTSTAMVFDHDPDGPHAPDDARTARDDYGRGKIACEDAVREAFPAACVARLGWQIDGGAQGNNMLFALDDWQRREGRVAASRLWRPACSFMADTVAALAELVETRARGVHHLDSNAAEGFRFDQIAAALRAAFGREGWRLEVTDGYRHDQRLIGGPTALPPLSARLPALSL